MTQTPFNAIFPQPMQVGVVGVVIIIGSLGG